MSDGVWFWQCECTHCPAPTYQQFGWHADWTAAMHYAELHGLEFHPRRHIPHDVK
jgi:hypothetical protein